MGNVEDEEASRRRKVLTTLVVKDFAGEAILSYPLQPKRCASGSLGKFAIDDRP